MKYPETCIHITRLTGHSPRQTQTMSEAVAILRNREAMRFKTLELPWRDNQRRISCIPPGSYTVMKHISPSFGKCFWVKDVPGRSHILIHAGNFSGSVNPRTGKPDTLGCILPGISFHDLDGDGIKEITNSRQILQKLLKLMPYQFELIITIAPQPQPQSLP